MTFFLTENLDNKSIYPIGLLKTFNKIMCVKYQNTSYKQPNYKYYTLRFVVIMLTIRFINKNIILAQLHFL